MKTKIFGMLLMACLLVITGCEKKSITKDSSSSGNGKYDKSYIESTLRAHSWKSVFTDYGDDGDYFQEKCWLHFDSANNGHLHWYDREVTDEGEETDSGDRPFSYSISGTIVTINFTDNGDVNECEFFDTYLKEPDSGNIWTRED